MAFDAFLQIKGSNAPTGESTDTAYSKWIELESFTFGATNPSTISSASPGSGAGRVSISTFTVTKKYDNASPDLFLGCCMGNQHIRDDMRSHEVSVGASHTTGQHEAGSGHAVTNRVAELE